LINEFYAAVAPDLNGLHLRHAHRRGASESRGVAHTVDQFQGDEAHVVLVSMVRNTRAEQQPKEDPAKPLGFLKDPSRMNVLLSRAQALLVVVGSWDFFQHVSAAIPPRDTVLGAADGEDDSAAHWPELIGVLREWFNENRAVRLDARAWLDAVSEEKRARAWRTVEHLIRQETSAS
jgi:hypothetical protein